LFFGPTRLVAQDADGVTQEEFEHVIQENQSVIDSLIALLMNDEETPEKVQIYIQLCEQYLQNDHSHALQYAQEGLTLAVKIEYTQGRLDCYMSIAHIHLAYTLELSQALSSYEKALDLARELKDRRSEMSILRGIAGVYSQLGNLEAAKDYFSMSLDIAKELKDDVEISKLNSYLGGVYEEMGDTLTALKYYNEVLETERRTKFQNTSNAALNTIAHYYFLNGDIAEAIRFYRIAMKRFQRVQDNRWLSYTHSQLAHLYFTEKNYERAEEHAINGLSIAQQFDLNKEITDNYKILIDIADSMGKPELAERYRKSYENMLSDIRQHADLLNSKLETTPPMVVNTETKSTNAMNRFGMAAVISLPVVILLMLVAWPRRKA